MLLGLLLGACHGQPKTAGPVATRTPDALRATLIFLSTPQPTPTGLTPTQVFELDATEVANLAAPTGQAETMALPTLEAPPTAAPDPLRFVFPTPGPAPVSAWRPPLYPVPWAPTPYDHFYFVRPIAADSVNWPVEDYRYGGVFFADVVHTGVDIPAPKGTPVLAAGPGRVIWAGYGLYRGGNDPDDPYGLAVTIRHDFGYHDQALYTVYGHLDQIDVVNGQHLEAGQQIGLVGETGRVTGPHLHFEIRLGNNDYFTTRNPELWMVPPMGWGIMAARVTDSSGQLLSGQHFIITSTTNRQNWLARTYGLEAVNSDAYYRENLVVGDLPAGVYELRTAYVGSSFSALIEIQPGLVSYFTFEGREGFVIGPPTLPGASFTPAPASTAAP
jgi:murein DD-endopeptidase MepM/ murein hydrolase activator NlpD